MLPLPSLHFLGGKLIVAEMSTKPPLSIEIASIFKIDLGWEKDILGMVHAAWMSQKR
jgi:hypothetical protein